ncbi:MAG TPA: fused response regulator/phosphatase [Blastocatellia bacterium]|nr:fused response regulator/phosphatase [Blastocatellia bacterium]
MTTMAPRPRTLIADDQSDIREALRLLLKGEGYQTEAVSSPAAVLDLIQDRQWDVLLMDLNYARDTTSGREGLDLLTRVRLLDSTLPVVVMTAWGSVDVAVEAMRQGSVDFVQKPWENENLLSILKSQVERGQLVRRIERLRAEKEAIRRAVASAGPVDQILEAASRGILRALGLRQCAFFVSTEYPNQFRIASGAESFEPSTIEVEDGEFGSSSGALISLPKSNLVPVSKQAMSQAGFKSLGAIGPPGNPPALVATSEEVFPPEEAAFISDVADYVAAALIGIEAHSRDREFVEAREIQLGLMPGVAVPLPGYTIASAWYPKRVVSGDYFDVLKFNTSHMAICVADVAGKGVPAAILMSNLQAMLRGYANSELQPSDLCSKLNTTIASNISPGRFITFFYGLLDAASSKLAYTNAGHNAPILLHRDRSCIRLRQGGAVLGGFADWRYDQGSVEIEPGDILVLFTDGLTEATSPAGEEFGEGRLIDLVRANIDLGAEGLKDLILQSVSHFTRGSFHDDATLIVMTAD